MTSRLRRQQGLTLVELLIAMVILSILGVIANQAIQQMVSSKQQLSARYEQWHSLARSFSRMDADLQQVGVREFNPAQNQALTALALQLKDNGQQDLVFWRLDPYYGTRLMGYRYVDQTVSLLRWPTADQTQAPETELMMTGVESLQWSFMGATNGVWTEQWPLPNQAGARPIGIRLTLKITGVGVITRSFALS